VTEQERIMQTIFDYFEGWYADVDRWHEDVDRAARTLRETTPADAEERRAA
jgi:hypothetical protein